MANSGVVYEYSYRDGRGPGTVGCACLSQTVCMTVCLSGISYWFSEKRSSIKRPHRDRYPRSTPHFTSLGHAHKHGTAPPDPSHVPDRGAGNWPTSVTCRYISHPSDAPERGPSKRLTTRHDVQQRVASHTPIDTHALPSSHRCLHSLSYHEKPVLSRRVLVPARCARDPTS